VGSETCQICFGKFNLPENQEMILCESCIVDIEKSGMFADELEGITWDWAKSPYKKYKGEN